ncbi:MAG: hypothetical protein ACREVH_02240, partial [Gammaproteobacteria bacterium]
MRKILVPDGRQFVSGSLTVRQTASERFDRIMVLLCGWLILGLYVDGWAHRHYPIETFFTPWHALLYSALLAVASLILVTVYRNPAGQRTCGRELSCSRALLGGCSLMCFWDRQAFLRNRERRHDGSEVDALRHQARTTNSVRQRAAMRMNVLWFLTGVTRGRCLAVASILAWASLAGCSDTSPECRDLLAQAHERVETGNSDAQFKLGQMY